MAHELRPTTLNLLRFVNRQVFTGANLSAERRQLVGSRFLQNTIVNRRSNVVQVERDAVRLVVANRGAEAADGGVENAMWFLCKAATVGSMRRWLGGDGQKMAAWNILCINNADQPLVIPRSDP